MKFSINIWLEYLLEKSILFNIISVYSFIYTSKAETVKFDEVYVAHTT